MRPKTQETKKEPMWFCAIEAGVDGVVDNERARARKRTLACVHLPATPRTVSPSLCYELLERPALQYFLARLCDLRVNPNERTRFGLRYVNTPQVQRLLRKLARQQCVSRELSSMDMNAIITTLKEVLCTFPCGIFDDASEEFVCVSPRCSLSTALLYVNGLIDDLPHFLRQFTYLMCRSLKNLIWQSAGSLTDAYTDALMLFTPVLFPNSVRDVGRFLRATRITLLLIDLCDSVFRPFLAISAFSDASDDEFFRDVVSSLSCLHECLEAELEIEDCGESVGEAPLEECVADRFPNKSEYYQLTFVFD